ncbi:MAG: T9SS type A sorting domain-containing protein [Salinibacter sp.]
MFLLSLAAGIVPEAQAQQDAAVSFPLSVALNKADTTATLMLGLDPEATSGIDSALGEVEYPPPPPESFDARLVDTNIEADLGEGVLVDIRPGDDSTGGTRTYELRQQAGPDEDTVTIAWDLPAGATGTLKDAESGGEQVNVDMEGEGDYALTDLSLTNFIVTVDYNAPPSVRFSLPADTLEANTPPLRLVKPEAAFRDPDGDSLSVTAESDAPSVLSAEQDLGDVVLTPNAVGSAEVTLIASDGTAEVSTAFPVEVLPEEGEAPIAQAAVAVDSSSENETVDFQDTGVKVAFDGISGSGRVDVERYDSGPDDPKGIEEATVSAYRAVIASDTGLTLDPGTEVRFRVQGDDPDGSGDFGGIGNPETVVMYRRPPADSASFVALPTSVDDNGTPKDISDDEIVGEPAALSTFVLASDDPDNPLPVEMTSLTATRSGKSVVLEWGTASETQNAGFEVQHRRPERSEYETVGFAEGSGTTDQPQSYRFRVKELSTGRHHFRLQQVDTDGTTTLTSPITVRVPAGRELALGLVGPNPAQHATTVEFTVQQDGRAVVGLYNVLGQRIKRLYEHGAEAGRTYTVRVPVQDVSSGTYFVRLAGPTGTRTQDVVVVR